MSLINPYDTFTLVTFWKFSPRCFYSTEIRARHLAVSASRPCRIFYSGQNKLEYALFSCFMSDQNFASDE